MLWQLYIRNGMVYVPTVAKTEAGFYMDIDPVRAVPATEPDTLRAAIIEAISNGNPVVPTPTRAAFPKPVILRHAGVKSWSTFEKSATYWEILETDGGYRIGPGKRSAAGGWEEDPERGEFLPPGTTVDIVAQRVATLLAATSRT
jgi:hypothetical protein